MAVTTWFYDMITCRCCAAMLARGETCDCPKGNHPGPLATSRDVPRSIQTDETRGSRTAPCEGCGSVRAGDRFIAEVRTDPAMKRSTRGERHWCMVGSSASPVTFPWRAECACGWFSWGCLAESRSLCFGEKACSRVGVGHD